ncbi:hypothetical protein R5R35_012119 [Gryllus longicercus]|uniref:Cytochrome P450 n=1 Tax=Gryllus longicercus TaxID=2509291 RepID=A0AAN9W1Y1_9ORTH
MKYLEAVIKETLRLYLLAPFLLRELEEEVKFEGYQLLPGITILLSVYMIHRHPDYFPEPEKFDPDRFSPERAKGRYSFAFIPFSEGPRNFIGQKFAMLGMKSIISKILRTYKLLPGTTQLVLAVDILLKTRTGVHIKLEDRK